MTEKLRKKMEECLNQWSISEDDEFGYKEGFTSACDLHKELREAARSLYVNNSMYEASLATRRVMAALRALGELPEEEA